LFLNQLEIGAGKLVAPMVPIADSICRFNPLYGQGMSVAAMEAVVLGQLSLPSA
jgi:hypothetical protein